MSNHGHRAWRHIVRCCAEMSREQVDSCHTLPSESLTALSRFGSGKRPPLEAFLLPRPHPNLSLLWLPSPPCWNVPGFPPTPPRGGRRWQSGLSNHGQRFQSTPPRGGRPECARAAPTLPSFNPRPRAGGDHACSDNADETQVSIHAPARGATSLLAIVNAEAGFQSTPPRGGRRLGRLAGSEGRKFQSTPPRGGRTWAIP